MAPALVESPKTAFASADPAAEVRLICISPNYAPEEIGIGGTVSPLVEGLARRSRATDVITTRPHYPGMVVSPGYRKGERDNEEVNGVQVHRIAARLPTRGTLLQRLGYELSLVTELFRVRFWGKVQPAPLVLAVCPSVLLVMLAPVFKARGGKVIALVYDIQSGLARTIQRFWAEPVGWVCQHLERVALNRADQIITLTDSMKAVLEANGITRPVTVLPPQVDTDAIRPRPEPELGPPTLIYSGNLGYKQGIFQLVDLAECLEKRRVNFRMIIRGDGSQKQALLDAIRAKGLRSVAVEPLLPRSELSKGLGSGHIHLVPQLPEGADAALPSKIFTIMAAGRPFIATALPGSPLAYFADEIGACTCVSPHDIEAFADAVEHLLENRGKRTTMGERGRMYVELNAGTAAIVKRVWDVLLDDAAAPAGVAPAPAYAPADELARARTGA